VKKLGILNIRLEEGIPYATISGKFRLRLPKKDLYDFLARKESCLENLYASRSEIFWDTGGDLIIANSIKDTFWRVYETPEQIQDLIEELQLQLILET